MGAPVRTTTCIGWLAELSAPARQRVLAVMRELADRSLSEWSKAQERSARPGERPAGSAFFDHVLKAELIDGFLAPLRNGSSPADAAVVSIAAARSIIQDHNARSPDDPVIRSGWVRDLDICQPYVAGLRAQVERCVGQIDLSPEAAKIVWAALWRQMDALRDERDAVHFERRPLDLIEADIASLVGVLRDVRAAGGNVSEATLSEMLAERGVQAEAV